ncbi:MAG: response regulator [Gammaproteobacteria bacterium]|nr:response regulator [Gammaproteobacteria bacterium]
MLLLTLVPLLIISLILGSYLARARIQDSESTLRERGEVLVRHLARESEFGLFSEDTKQLEELTGIAAREDDVYDVSVLNADREILTYAGAADPDRFFLKESQKDHLLLRFVAPVYRSGVAISDNAEQYREDTDSALARDRIIGWVELRLSRAETLARQREIVQNIILLTLGSSLLCALLAFWMGKGIVLPIMQLSRAVDSIRKGGLDTRVKCASGGEIGALENGFNDMAAAMERSQIHLQEEIRNATNKLSLLLESLPVAVFHAELSGHHRIFFMTQSVKQITGFDAPEFTNDASLWIDRIHPDDRDQVLSGLAEIQSSGQHEFEYRWEMKDAGYHWFYCYVRSNEAPSPHLIGLLQDITEFKKLSQQLKNTITSLREKNHELDQSRKEALDAGRNKAVFLANMSHEIRTPLSSIIGYTSKMESILGAGVDGDAIRECTRIISHASEQLKRIIDDILSFSKLESGTVQLEQVPFDLRADFEDVIRMMSSESGDKRIELSLLIDSDVPTKLIGDPNRINQVLFNLLSNAIKFTDSGYVDVHVSTKDDQGDYAVIELCVSDTGIGMSQDAVKNIFNAFHQGDASIARRYGGTGLGLSIVSRVVELWGGKLAVESAPGKGSRFCFTLNCRKQELMDDFPVDDRIRGRKVLVYDDHQPALKATRGLLLGWSMNIYLARSRCQMKTMIDEANAAGEPYDLIVIGAGILGGAPGAIGLNILLGIIRDNYDIPLLLQVNRQDMKNLDAPHGSAMTVMEKPVCRDALYYNVCRLLDVEVARPIPPALSGPDDNRCYEGVRVLLAEDNEFNSALITAVLETRGLVVSQVDDGMMALERAREGYYDLAILDIHLPGMDGSETARRIRAVKPEYRSMPIIALTADIFFDTPDNLASCGIDACLLKPLNEDKLWRLISSLRTAQAVPPDTSGDGAQPVVRYRPQVLDNTKMLPALAASLVEMSERLDFALRNGLSEELHSIIHEMKGVVCYFGLSELSRTVLEAEKLLADGVEYERAATCLRKLMKQAGDFAAAYGNREREFDVSQ